MSSERLIIEPMKKWQEYNEYSRTGFPVHPFAFDPDKKKLNLGCGMKAFGDKNWINLDMFGEPPIVVHNVIDFPWPFEDNQFDYIVAMQFFEHIPHHVHGFDGEFFNYFLDEIFRIIRSPGILEIVGPHPLNKHTLTRMGHTRKVAPETFEEYLIHQEKGSAESNKWVDGVRLKLLMVRTFRKFHFLGLDDYHFRKYLGLNIGSHFGLLFQLEVTKDYKRQQHDQRRQGFQWQKPSSKS